MDVLEPVQRGRVSSQTSRHFTPINIIGDVSQQYSWLTPVLTFRDLCYGPQTVRDTLIGLGVSRRPFTNREKNN